MITNRDIRFKHNVCSAARCRAKTHTLYGIFGVRTSDTRANDVAYVTLASARMEARLCVLQTPSRHNTHIHTLHTLIICSPIYI